MLFNFLNIALAIRVSNQEQLGLWLTILSVMMWINYFDMGLGAGTRNLFIQKNNDTNRLKTLIANSYTIVSILGLALYLISYILFTFFTNTNSDISIFGSLSQKDLTQVIFITMPTFILIFILSICRQLFVAIEKNYINEIFNLVASITSAIFLLNHYFSGRSITWFDMSLVFTLPVLLSLIFLNSYFYLQNAKIFPTFKSINLKESGGLFNLSIKFFTIQLTGLITISSTNVIIAAILSPDAVVTYQTAYQLFGIMLILMTVTSNPLVASYGNLFKQKKYSHILKTKKNMEIYAFSIVILGLIILFFAQNIFKLWLGSEFEYSFQLALVMFLYFSSTILIMPTTTFITATSKVKLITIISLVNVVIFLPLAIFLVTVLGTVGIAVALLITSSYPIPIILIQANKILKRTESGIWAK
jgi:O-antigen/teichoic acid export membrane protein